MSNETTETVSPELPTAEKPMVIERIRANREGGIEFVMSLTKEQTYILVNFAVMALVSQGLAVFQDEPEPEAKAEETPQEAPKEENLTLGKQLH